MRDQARRVMSTLADANAETLRRLTIPQGWADETPSWASEPFEERVKGVAAYLSAGLPGEPFPGAGANPLDDSLLRLEAIERESGSDGKPANPHVDMSTIEADPFEAAVYARTAGLAETLVAKHHDYGPLNISRSPGGALNGLRVRMYDKLARINNLVDTDRDPANEPLRDSFLDMAGYALIGLLVLDGEWPGE